MEPRPLSVSQVNAYLAEIAPPGTEASNYGFDITPARLVTGFITERGVAPATRDALAALYPEHRKGQGA